MSQGENKHEMPPNGASRSVPGSLRVLIAASGTGGHLIPALHIAKALERAAPGCVIEFVGAGRPLEEKLVVAAGYVRHVVSSAGVKRRNVVGVLQFLWRLPLGLAQVVGLYRRFRPDVVVGVGGYVSVLPVVVARCMGIPSWCHEAELHPGLANSVLGYFARSVSVSFQATRIRGGARIEFTGHPVRPELARVDRLGVRDDAPKRLLVLGGSQGARGLDSAVPEVAPLLADRNIEVVHQCRPESMELVMNCYRAAQVKASVVSFIDDMAGAYDWSDLIVSRAGASSVAEIACVNRPAIFVPYPFQQGTHQSDNARALESLGKALVVEEARPEFGRRLREALESLLDPSRYRSMKGAPSEPRGLQAADRIAAGVLGLVGAGPEPGPQPATAGRAVE